jgi:sugar phosphate isomerase/epimerase
MQRKISIQLYSIRDQLALNFSDSLRRLAEIGYQWIETYGHFYGGLSSKEFSALLLSLNLKVSSSHADIKLLKEKLPEIIEYNLALNCRHIVCAYADYKIEQDVLEAAAFFNEVAGKCRDAGMAFSYHNHAHEFNRYPGGIAMDILLENADRMGLELDVYWAAKAGIDPVAYQKKWEGRSTLLHCKDMDGGPERRFAAVGEGILDFPAVIRAASLVEYFIVEQDQSDDPFHSAELSFTALKKLLAI